MPSGDRTGPRGQGSMTGRGLGFCSGYDNPGFAVDRGYGGGRGMGYGRGRGMGYGRGRYRDPYYAPYGPNRGYYPPRVPVSAPVDQVTMLKQEKNYLESELKGIGSAIEDISKRIEELEKKE